MGDLNYTMPRGPAVWQFEDGWVECGDLLIGADGSGSTVRQQLLPDVTAHYAGYVAWRGLVGEADVPEEAAAILCERFTFYEFPNSGDYALLDYLVRSCLRRLRQAGAILGIVFWFIFGIVNFDKATGLGLILATETQSANASRSIHVFRPPNEMEIIPRNSASDCQIARNCEKLWFADAKFSFVKNFAPEYIVFRWAWQWRLIIIESDHALRDSCVRAADILDCESYFKIFITGNQMNVSDREFGRMCRDKFFARKIDAFPGQRGLLVCSEPQRASERGNYDGSESCDTPVVALDKFTRTSNISANRRGTESGWIFFGGSAVVCIFVLLYAALKDWRDGTLSKNKSPSQKYNKG